MTGKTEQRSQHEHDGQRYKVDTGLRRHQQVHRHRAEPEIDHADQYLNERQPRRRQCHFPAILAKLTAILPDSEPGQISGDAAKATQRDQPIHRGRQQIHRGRSPGVPSHAEPEHHKIAEPER